MDAFASQLYSQSAGWLQSDAEMEYAAAARYAERAARSSHDPHIQQLYKSIADGAQQAAMLFSQAAVDAQAKQEQMLTNGHGLGHGSSGWSPFNQ